MTGSERRAPASALLAVVLAAGFVSVSERHPSASGGSSPGRVDTLRHIRMSAPAMLQLRLPALLVLERPDLDSARTHVIAPGETLWDISRAAGVSVAALADANHISKPAALHPGQVLVIPEPETGPPSTPPAFQSQPPQIHTVAPGETLWEIARSSGVSVAALASANDLAPDVILRPRRLLIVPSPGTSAPASPSGLSSRRPGLAKDGPGRSTGPVHLAGRATRVAPAGEPPAQTQTIAQRLQLLWPSSGTVTSRFGWRIHPIFGTREFHTGLDIATRWGSPVLAARTGIVRFAGWMAGYGRLIVVDHGSGLQTMYSHLSAVLVGCGDQVTKGQMIGRIGSTGWSTGPHLFFEVRQNGVPEDPTSYLH